MSLDDHLLANCLCNLATHTSSSKFLRNVDIRPKWLHHVTTQKTKILIIPAVRTSKPIKSFLKYEAFFTYCDGPLLHNERLLTGVISTVTNTENYPIIRNS
jgi:hypothetical protein